MNIKGHYSLYWFSVKHHHVVLLYVPYLRTLLQLVSSMLYINRNFISDNLLHSCIFILHYYYYGFCFTIVYMHKNNDVCTYSLIITIDLSHYFKSCFKFLPLLEHHCYNIILHGIEFHIVLMLVAKLTNNT